MNSRQKWGLKKQTDVQVSQDISYQIFATSATFFVPLVLILLLYWRIFLTARSVLFPEYNFQIAIQYLS